MPTLAKAVVESFLTMLDVQGLSPLSSAAQIVELESTAASTVKMLESGVWVRSCCNHSFKDMYTISSFSFLFCLVLCSFNELHLWPDPLERRIKS